jgi:hypothetical protein
MSAFETAQIVKSYETKYVVGEPLLNTRTGLLYTNGTPCKIGELVLLQRVDTAGNPLRIPPAVRVDDIEADPSTPEYFATVQDRIAAAQELPSEPVSPTIGQLSVSERSIFVRPSADTAPTAVVPFGSGSYALWQVAVAE